MIKAASLATEINLLHFSQSLKSQGIFHRISEESGQQIIWVEGEQQVALVRGALDCWSFEERNASPIRDSAKLEVKRTLVMGLYNVLRAYVHSPVSMAMIAACVVVAVFSSLGTQPQRVAFLFYPLLDTSGFTALLISIDSVSELLRSFSPMLLHFGELHLVFNMLWLWYFGRQLESTHPRWLFVVLILLCSFTANTTQYLYSGYNNFGGMSGVVYGLLGYTWIIHKFMPGSQLLISSGMFVVFVIALILMEITASSWIASAAHVGGLISGLLFGILVLLTCRFVLGRSAITKSGPV